LSNQCPHRRQVYAVCATHLLARLRAARFERARLSALTLAALATGSTRWLSSRTGFPAAVADGSFARFAQTLPRLSTLRADRSLCRSTGDPKPPGCGSDKPPRAGTASHPHQVGVNRFDVPSTGETAAVIVIAAAKSKAFEFHSMNQTVLPRRFSFSSAALQ